MKKRRKHKKYLYIIYLFLSVIITSQYIFDKINSIRERKTDEAFEEYLKKNNFELIINEKNQNWFYSNVEYLITKEIIFLEESTNGEKEVQGKIAIPISKKCLKYLYKIKCDVDLDNLNHLISMQKSYISKFNYTSEINTDLLKENSIITIEAQHKENQNQPKIKSDQLKINININKAAIKDVNLALNKFKIEMQNGEDLVIKELKVNLNYKDRKELYPSITLQAKSINKEEIKNKIIEIKDTKLKTEIDFENENTLKLKSQWGVNEAIVLFSKKIQINESKAEFNIEFHGKNEDLENSIIDNLHEYKTKINFNKIETKIDNIYIKLTGNILIPAYKYNQNNFLELIKGNAHINIEKENNKRTIISETLSKMEEQKLINKKDEGKYEINIKIEKRNIFLENNTIGVI